jgi:GT2 family glycosyltransferase
MKTHVSIVIPTWNGLALLKRFLPSVIAAANYYLEKPDHRIEVILVDDGSTDETVQWLESDIQTLGNTSRMETSGNSIIRKPDSDGTGLKLSAELRCVKNEKNLGFSAACNNGIAAAQYPLVFLLNNDVELDREAIAPLVENFADEKVFAVHCRVFALDSDREVGTGKIGSFARGFIRVHQSYATTGDDQKLSLQPLYSIFAGGGSAMIDREKFLAIGGFDGLLSPYYWEDVELSYRAWKRGYTVLYEPRSVAWHRVSSTIGKLNPRHVRMIEQRNRLIYHWIHLQDFRMLSAHILWVMILAMTASLRFQPIFFLSFMEALKRLPAIRKRRQEEKQNRKRSDRELFSIFRALKRRKDVQVYDKIKDE